VTGELRRVVTSRELRIVFVLLAMWMGLGLHPTTREAFVSVGNFGNLTAQVSEIMVLGVGMTMVVLVAGIDLSVGAGIALGGVVAAKLQIDAHQPAWVAVLATVAACTLVGIWHGVLVARFSVPPFIATLSGFLAYRGVALVLSDARGLAPMGEDFQALGGRVPGTVASTLAALGLAVGVALVLRRAQRRKRAGLVADPPLIVGLRLAAIVAAGGLALLVYRDGAPTPVVIAAGAVALGAVVLRRTRLGRYAFAIGGNVEAARLSGVPVARVTALIYTGMGALTGVAAVVAAARTNGVTPGNAGLMRELHVITAVVIGGTSLSGGRATMIGTVIGALVFGTLSNGMNLMGVDSNWQLIVTGLILLGASLLDALSSRKR